MSSARGTAIVEIVGKPSPLTGKIGTTGGLRNYVRLHSEGGDVQLSQLESPY